MTSAYNHYMTNILDIPHLQVARGSGFALEDESPSKSEELPIVERSYT